MKPIIYRFSFSDDLDMTNVEETLLFSLIVIEQLHGESATRLEARTLLDLERRKCVIDASRRIGRDLARLFTGFLTREFGPDAFEVERAEKSCGRFADIASANG